MSEKKLKAIRDGFGEALVEVGEKNKNIVVLTANLMESTRVHLFAEKFPERFFDVGVAEQALVTVAAGMGLAGKIPFITSYAVFSPGRTFEQIKITAALNDVPVKVIGAHGGFGAANLGATHESLEDIAMMRAMPNMIVIQPADYEETKKATHAISNNGKPSYLRLSKQETEVFTRKEDKFEIGKVNVLKYAQSPQVAIIGCGPVLSEALKAAEELKEKDIEVMVVNCHTIKPIDEEGIVKAAKLCGAVVTVEEHQIMGGMGSAVAEVLARRHPVPIEFIGVKDSFGESARDWNELWDKFDLRAKNIEEKVRKVITRKN
jgi:transketolase